MRTSDSVGDTDLETRSAERGFARRRARGWGGSTVEHFKGSVDALRRLVPDFVLRPFNLAGSSGPGLKPNDSLDAVVRLPYRDDQDAVPVGVVSKSYVLVPHRDVYEAAVSALEQVGVAPESVRAEMTLTRLGERMALSLYMPSRYDFDPGDGNLMSLRLECMNSVDSSTRLTIFVGWFRFICLNGLVVGVLHARYRTKHIGDVSVGDATKILKDGITEATRERRLFDEWIHHRVSRGQVVKWADTTVKEVWGFKAAARTIHIAMNGLDVDVTPTYKRRLPSEALVANPRQVPGCSAHADNAYDVCQVLAWLARSRADIQEQLEWRRDIPVLMASLLSA